MRSVRWTVWLLCSACAGQTAIVSPAGEDPVLAERSQRLDGFIAASRFAPLQAWRQVAPTADHANAEVEIPAARCVLVVALVARGRVGVRYGERAGVTSRQSAWLTLCSSEDTTVDITLHSPPQVPMLLGVYGAGLYDPEPPLRDFFDPQPRPTRPEPVRVVWSRVPDNPFEDEPLVDATCPAPTVARVAGADDVTEEASDGPRRDAARRHYEQGVEAMQREAWTDAARAFEISLACRLFAPTLINLAAVRAELGHRDEAVRLYEGFFDVFPEAEERYRRAVEDGLARVAPSTVRVRLGETPLFEETCEHADAPAAERARAVRRRRREAAEQRRAGQWLAAFASYRHAYLCLPRAATLLGAAEAAEHIGDVTLALRLFEAVLQRFPNASAPLRRRANLGAGRTRAAGGGTAGTAAGTQGAGMEGAGMEGAGTEGAGTEGAGTEGAGSEDAVRPTPSRAGDT